ncbi:hypothetical protein I5I01_gp68 [Mycobacterium phage MooMoo]|uniref:Uncharacterized protein n=1 Tax=Mycobacterium phage MooMoo TaxID=2108127 RepID=A0A2P1JRC6_9CAUD|nr:hypothetical protein I5I01_gp68 [Mycobacterium phage MooMoo]AVO21673.1 hypothetical protein SEA_MOOMOO_68 [Mycobacterium phage MooMoo]
MSKNSGIPGKTVPQAIRSAAAEERAQKRATRSDAQQLAMLDTRPGNAVRERARLAAS